MCQIPRDDCINGTIRAKDGTLPIFIRPSLKTSQSGMLEISLAFQLTREFMRTRDGGFGARGTGADSAIGQVLGWIRRARYRADSAIGQVLGWIRPCVGAVTDRGPDTGHPCYIIRSRERPRVQAVV